MRTPAERAYFETYVRPRLGAGVEYAGEVGGADKHALLAGARALVNPIGWPEPFGLVMIEAMACGTPVLAYPSGAAPEIVEHGVTGLLCQDADELTAAFEKIDLLDRTACREAVETRFSAARMVAEHADLYASLA